MRGAANWEEKLKAEAALNTLELIAGGPSMMKMAIEDLVKAKEEGEANYNADE